MEKTPKGITELFLHRKPVGIIMSLKGSDGKYASILSKENDCTYTHTLKILTDLKNYGVVEFKKEGRIKGVKLTQIGEDIAHEFEGLVRHLERLSGNSRPKVSKLRDEVSDNSMALPLKLRNRVSDNISVVESKLNKPKGIASETEG